MRRVNITYTYNQLVELKMGLDYALQQGLFRGEEKDMASGLSARFGRLIGRWPSDKPKGGYVGITVSSKEDNILDAVGDAMWSHGPHIEVGEVEEVKVEAPRLSVLPHKGRATQTLYVSYKEAQRLLPTFRWLEANAPIKEGKEAAYGVLRELELVGDIDYGPLSGKQITLSPRDKEFFEAFRGDK